MRAGEVWGKLLLGLLLAHRADRQEKAGGKTEENRSKLEATGFCLHCMEPPPMGIHGAALIPPPESHPSIHFTNSVNEPPLVSKLQCSGSALVSMAVGPSSKQVTVSEWPLVPPPPFALYKRSPKSPFETVVCHLLSLLAFQLKSISLAPTMHLWICWPVLQWAEWLGFGIRITHFSAEP